jgi:hypothetical protein
VMGTSPHAPATNRCVPSPPRTTMALAPAATICVVPRTVSAGPSSTCMSRNTTFGPRSSGLRVASARRTRSAIPPRSGIIRMLVTPVTPSAEISRVMMLHFSAIVKTPPRATRRRMSRPEAGLAMIPTTFSRVEKIFAEPSLPDPLLMQEDASTINLNRLSENFHPQSRVQSAQPFNLSRKAP